MIENFLNPKDHPNPINGSKLTAILLKGWILPLGGDSAVEGLRSTGLPRLVYKLKSVPFGIGSTILVGRELQCVPYAVSEISGWSVGRLAKCLDGHRKDWPAKFSFNIFR